MRSMAATGMAFRSVPVFPRHGAEMLINEDWCRRFPLTARGFDQGRAREA